MASRHVELAIRKIVSGWEMGLPADTVAQGLPDVGTVSWSELAAVAGQETSRGALPERYLRQVFDAAESADPDRYVDNPGGAMRQNAGIGGYRRVFNVYNEDTGDLLGTVFATSPRDAMQQATEKYPGAPLGVGEQLPLERYEIVDKDTNIVVGHVMATNVLSADRDGRAQFGENTVAFVESESKGQTPVGAKLWSGRAGQVVAPAAAPPVTRAGAYSRGRKNPDGHKFQVGDIVKRTAAAMRSMGIVSGPVNGRVEGYSGRFVLVRWSDMDDREEPMAQAEAGLELDKRAMAQRGRGGGGGRPSNVTKADLVRQTQDPTYLMDATVFWPRHNMPIMIAMGRWHGSPRHGFDDEYSRRYWRPLSRAEEQWLKDRDALPTIPPEYETTKVPMDWDIPDTTTVSREIENDKRRKMGLPHIEYTDDPVDNPRGDLCLVGQDGEGDTYAVVVTDDMDFEQRLAELDDVMQLDKPGLYRAWYVRTDDPGWARLAPAAERFAPFTFRWPANENPSMKDFPQGFLCGKPRRKGAGRNEAKDTWHMVKTSQPAGFRGRAALCGVVCDFTVEAHHIPGHVDGLNICDRCYGVWAQNP